MRVTYLGNCVCMDFLTSLSKEEGIQCSTSSSSIIFPSRELSVA